MNDAENKEKEFLSELTKLSQKYGMSIGHDKDGLYLSEGSLWYALNVAESSASQMPYRIVTIYPIGN